MKISFTDNVAGNHGDVLRSSAIFYARSGKFFRTVVSFLNYWQIKRGTTVAVYMSLRTMSGALVRRQRVEFDKGAVLNLSIDGGAAGFEGSVEIEIFSTRNLVFPYPAIMVVYESRFGIAMVHSYARSYSAHEIEEGRTITEGHEGCWTLRDDGARRSFCVIHNGGIPVAAQEASFTATNQRGESRTAAVHIEPLAPYQTVRLEASELDPGLVQFLRGKPGWGALDFRLGQSFTRMLVGTELADGEDFQVTHSNFDYRKHETEAIAGEGARGYMFVPGLKDGVESVYVYPHSRRGNYNVRSAAGRTSFSGGEGLVIPIAKNERMLEFTSSGGEFPARLVTALVSKSADRILPNECSLGVLTPMQPRKRLWWGICASGRDMSSRLVVHDMKPIYGGCGTNHKLEVALYSASSNRALSKTIALPETFDGTLDMDFEELFPEMEEFLNGEFGYFTLFDSYGGVQTYSALRRGTGSLALEHSF